MFSYRLTVPTSQAVKPDNKVNLYLMHGGRPVWVARLPAWYAGHFCKRNAALIIQGEI